MPVVRWGLAAKLFATLILLGAVAILVTGLLGYVRSRDALEAAILNQLTAARQSWGTIQAVYDVGPPPPTYLLRRGNLDRPGAEV